MGLPVPQVDQAETFSPSRTGPSSVATPTPGPRVLGMMEAKVVMAVTAATEGGEATAGRGAAAVCSLPVDRYQLSMVLWPAIRLRKDRMVLAVLEEWLATAASVGSFIPRGTPLRAWLRAPMAVLAAQVGPDQPAATLAWVTEGGSSLPTAFSAS